MKAEAVFTLLVVVLAEGRTTKPPYNLQCYKKTTDPDEDFICTWSSVMPLENVSYTLFYQAENKPLCKLCTGLELTCKVPREFLITKRMINMWLEANINNHTDRSPNLTVILENQVKYDAPEIKIISRSSKTLTLRWDRPEREKGAIHEIALRELGSEQWRNQTIETNDDPNTPENCAINIEHNACYEVSIRRRAKQVKTQIWSDWSQIKEVPTELDSQPKVEWKVGNLQNGTRLLKLVWEEFSRNASCGGLHYEISTSFAPCWAQFRIFRTETTNYSLNIPASAININITAVNNFGPSPVTQITIPAEFIDTCQNSQAKSMTRLRDVHPKKKCIVWYALADGQTKLYHVKHWKVNDKTHVIRKMKKDMEDFVRYHYIINTKANNGMLRTIEMCAVYKKEGAPRSSPEKVTVLNKTHGSAVLRWEPLPVSQQRGFLTNYMIYISGSDRNETANVSWLQTNFTLQNLKHGTTYTVRLAGKTAAGVGPNTTKIFQTNPEPRATKGLSRSDKIITAMCLIALSVTALCSFIIKCFKGKLLPTVPSPVIPETPGCRTDHENESYPVGEEEVDSLILLPHVRNESSRRESQEEGNSVEFCETPSYDQDDDESPSDSEVPDGSSFALSPDYNRQIHSLPAPPGQKELGNERSKSDMIPSYKNGLVLEMRENAPEEVTELWQILK